MRDLVTVVCFVSLLTGLGLAETFYKKWRTYVACSQVNLLVAQGQFEKSLEFILLQTEYLNAETIDEAVELCDSVDAF